jgi:hypothetical protein
MGWASLRRAGIERRKYAYAENVVKWKEKA